MRELLERKERFAGRARTTYQRRGIEYTRLRELQQRKCCLNKDAEQLLRQHQARSVQRQYGKQRQ